MENIYSIQLASRISGVGIHTIRAWEKRYGAVVPQRNPSGRREYSDIDIERLVLLSELCVLGHSIGQIARYPTPDLKELLKKLGKMNPNLKSSEVTQLERSPVDIENSLQGLLLALRSYKLDIISHEIQKLKILLGPRELALDILAPLLREVGRCVAEKSLNISQEHALGSLLKFHIGHALFKVQDSKVKKADTIILTTPEGENHEFGIFNAGLLCGHYGFKFYYLGASLPVSSMLDAYQSVEASKIILGVSPDYVGPSENALDLIIEKILNGLDPKGELIVYGHGPYDKKRHEASKQFRSFEQLKDVDVYLKQL
jgi:DNA-binding transcriptional MerR regulator